MCIAYTGSILPTAQSETLGLAIVSLAILIAMLQGTSTLYVLIGDSFAYLYRCRIRRSGSSGIVTTAGFAPDFSQTKAATRMVSSTRF